ncbi:MAG TPA: MFS transporter [Solirubrobacteraceae bacterium]|nr:MFS transporter [Solirubrobacteraceae bacterium]
MSNSSHPHRSSLILAVLAAAGTTFALLQAIVVPALPTIQHAFGVSSGDVAWILTLNLLSTAVLTPVLGRAGDIHGKSRVLTATMAVLACGTLIAALASSLPLMLAGRVIQGAGGAVYPLAFGIVRDELPPERVPGGIGLVSSLLGIGAGLGLVVPGFILQHLSYHWLFWLPLIVLVPTTALTARCVPASRAATSASINWASALLMSLGLGAVLVAISEAGAWGWGAPRTLGLAAAGLLLVIGWVANEVRSSEPLVDMRIMATRGVWTANLAAFLLGVGMYSSIAVIPALVQLPRITGFGFGGSAVTAGLFMLPTAAIQLLIGPFCGRIDRRLGARAMLQAGLACSLAAYLILVAGHGAAVEVIGAMVILGIGLGLGLSSLANLVVAAVRPGQTGVATGMNTVMRTLGGAFGAQLVATVIASSHGPAGLPADRGFTLAFAMCAVALAAGLAGARLVPGRRAPRMAVVSRRRLPAADAS